MTATDLDKLAGQPVDIAPWAYAWRADRAVQEKPEAYFIPRRLDRIDKVYRTAYAALSPDRLKSIAYANQPDLLKPLLPKPTGPTAGGIALDGQSAGLQGGASVAGRAFSRYPIARCHRSPRLSHVVGLVWVDRRSDSEESGDFGGPAHVDVQERYSAKMDFSYNNQIDAATEMVAVFYDKAKAPGGRRCRRADHPRDRSESRHWKRMDVEIEWGFQPGTEKSEFDGRLESHRGDDRARCAVAGGQGDDGDGGEHVAIAGDGRFDATRHCRAVAVCPRQLPRPGQPGDGLDKDGRFHVSH